MKNRYTKLALRKISGLWQVRRKPPFWAIILIAAIVIYYGCIPPKSNTAGDNGIFYYGTNERIPLNTVSNSLVYKLKDKTSIAASFSQLLARFGQTKRITSDVFSITTANASRAKLLRDSMLREDDVLSVNYLYKTKDGQDLYITNDICLEFNKQVTPQQRETILQQFDAREVVRTKPWESYFTIITIGKDKNALDVANRIRESGLVKFSHPNFIARAGQNFTPADPYFARQFYLHNTGQEIVDGHTGKPDADIDAVEAWDITRGSAAITVAVIDEGVALNNNDLPAARLVVLPGSDFTTDGSPDDPSPEGDGAHGTACAGIIAAEHNNSEGVAGIAPLCRIMPVRLPFGFGFIPASTFADAINFAWSNGADVLSNSWYYGAPDMGVITVAINNAITMGRGGRGSVVVFAAGNTANHVGGINGYVTYPASAPVPALITVGASDRNDEQANYSPDGAAIDVVAPSHRAYPSQIPTECFEVWTTDITGNNGYNALGDACGAPFTTLPNSGTNFRNYTARMGGTSSSCPQVAAAAALLLSVNPALTPAQVQTIITSTADKVGGYVYTAGRSVEMGFGRLNLYNMLAASLWSKDTPSDPGTEPNATSTHMYLSDDIWVRKTADGDPMHQNAEYRDPATGVPNAVYVKVRNAGNVAGTATVKLYWAKASSGLAWPAPWDGSVTAPALMGGFIGSSSVTVPAVGETILRFEWFPPNPANYTMFGPDQFHFCLLSRIETSATAPFGMAFPETGNLGANVANNNNIVWKNIAVRDDAVGASSSSGILIANYAKKAELTRLVFSMTDSARILLNNYGTLSFTLPEKLYEKWKKQGGKSVGLKNDGRTFQFTAARAWLGDFVLDVNEIHGLQVVYKANVRHNQRVNAAKNTKFDFHIDQYIVNGNTLELKGGQLFNYYLFKQ